jgi:RNA methyltransferase PUA domain
VDLSSLSTLNSQLNQMHRFYLPPKEWNSASPALDEGESHHVLDVLRFGQGDHVTVFDGEGAEARADIVAVEGGRIRLRIGQKTQSQPLFCAITLAQAIPKGNRLLGLRVRGVALRRHRGAASRRGAVSLEDLARLRRVLPESSIPTASPRLVASFCAFFVDTAFFCQPNEHTQTSGDAQTDQFNRSKASQGVEHVQEDSMARRVQIPCRAPSS